MDYAAECFQARRLQTAREHATIRRLRKEPANPPDGHFRLVSLPTRNRPVRYLFKKIYRPECTKRRAVAAEWHFMAQPPKTSEEAIVAATIAIIEQQGIDHLSVRAVARKLGLAPNALYYHFRQRKMLEAAVATHGMRRMNAVMKKTAARLRGEEAIRRACRAYLRYGRSHPAIYAMLMKKYPEVPGLLAERENFREGALRLLAGLGDRQTAGRASLALWALLHGLVQLEAEGLLARRELTAGASFGVSALMAGLSSS